VQRGGARQSEMFGLCRSLRGEAAFDGLDEWAHFGWYA
jgi:hypothetical protein